MAVQPANRVGDIHRSTIASQLQQLAASFRSGKSVASPATFGEFVRKYESSSG